MYFLYHSLILFSEKNYKKEAKTGEAGHPEAGGVIINIKINHVELPKFLALVLEFLMFKLSFD